MGTQIIDCFVLHHQAEYYDDHRLWLKILLSSMSTPRNNQSSLTNLPSPSPSTSLAIRSSSRTRTPVKRHVPQEDPRRRSEYPSDRKRSRERSRCRSSATHSHRKKVTIIETQSTSTHSYSPSSTESEYSTEPEITVLPKKVHKKRKTTAQAKQQPQKQSKHSLSSNPADWKVDTDDSDLDDNYTDLVYKYARHCSEKLAKKKLRDREEDIA